MNLVSAGLRSCDIADVLFLSKRTVDFHLAGVFAKLGVNNRIQAIRATQRLGLFPFEPATAPNPKPPVLSVVGMADSKQRD